MGSLRNPIGPLPSSIYWRRRAAAASLIALLAIIAVWVLSTGGRGGGDDGKAKGASTEAPSTITPGPSQSGPAISEQPGGRENPGGSDGSGDSGGPGGSGGSSAGSGSGGADGSPGSGGDQAGSGSGGAGSGGGAGRRVNAGSALPDCPSGALQLALTTRNDYAPGQKPSFRLSARNTSATTCKADFGPRAAVLTIRDDEADAVWSSKDCPKTGGLLLQVPAGSSITHTVEWDRRQSEPNCATPRAGAVPAGTYLVELRFPGESMSQQSFVLKKD